MKSRDADKPFFLYVSHKAVHADFVPADRHRGRYDNEPLPIEIPTTEAMEAGNKPMWVRNQRNSRHGVDFGYNLPGFSPEVYYRRYCESLLAVDESVGQLREFLKQQDLDQNTIVVYMGDNGFSIWRPRADRQNAPAYEASAKVPLLVVAPGKIPAGVPFDGPGRQHRHRPHATGSRQRLRSEEHERAECLESSLCIGRLVPE